VGRSYDLEDRLVALAAVVCRVAASVRSDWLGSHIAGQLVWCGTSPAANYAEARSAESKRDFVHKMKVCLKELRETMVWLQLLKELGFEAVAGVDGAIQESNELISIFVASVATAQGKKKPRP